MKSQVVFFRLLLTVILISVLAAGLFFAESASAYDYLLQEATPMDGTGDAMPVLSSTDVFTFNDFGFDEITLRGPFAVSAYFFDFLPTWEMSSGAEIHLVIDTFYTGAITSQTGENVNYGGTLIVQYNYVTLAALDLNQEGQREIVIPLSLDVLKKVTKNQSQSIQFILDSGVNCDEHFITTVVIRNNSQLYLPHQEVSPPVDLTLLPSPFFQNSINSDEVVMVIPDSPTTGELSAAMALAAGFGRMTSGRLLMTMMLEEQLTPEVLTANNIIFVVGSNGSPLLRDVQMPVPVSDAGFQLTEFENDGVIQVVVSPWNETKVIMIVGGNNDQAIINAARAVGTGNIRVGNEPGLSIVSGTNLYEEIFNPTIVDQTLSDMGYDSSVITHTGLSNLNYEFIAPKGYALAPDAYLELSFSHTALLEDSRSNILVQLNGQPVGSIQLSADTYAVAEKRIALPSSVLRPGVNRLQLIVNLQPRDECANTFLEGLWLRVDSSSKLHLPFVPNPSNPYVLLDLRHFPAPFAFDPKMSDLAFIVAQNDPVGWDAASRLAFYFGNVNSVEFSGLEVYFSDAVPDDIRSNKNLILFGKPVDLSILGDMSDELPVQFEKGTNLALEENLQVSYRIGENVDVGYLELLPNPWNNDLSVLYVGGTSNIGVKWAADALQFGGLRSQLHGNLAFINAEQIVSVDTRIIQGSQSTLSMIIPSEVTPEPLPTQPAVSGKPDWILPGIFFALGCLILVIIVLVSRAIFGVRSRQKEE